MRYTKNGATYDKTYYHADGLGSVVALTKPDGTITAAQMFDSWGTKIASSSIGTVPGYGYTGREPDGTGLIYYRARYYDPGVGRFVSQDPIGMEGGLNLYAYVGNNPTNFTDPSGLIAAGSSAAIPSGGGGGSGKNGPSSNGANASVFNTTATASSGNQSLGAFASDGGVASSQGPVLVAAWPLIPLLGLGLTINDVVNNDTPIPGSGAAQAGAKLAGAGANAAKRAQIHHICTDKNCISTIAGGPWTPRFEAIFEKAGMQLKDALNKVAIPGHQGPHPEAYHQAVFDRLTTATRDLSGTAYRDVLQTELRAISTELRTPGSVLNRFTTKP